MVIGMLLMKEGEIDDKLPVGSKMPNYSFIAKSGERVILSSSLHADGEYTILIYFNTECRHCVEELNQLNTNIEKFETTNILLMTSEQDFFTKTEVHSWHELTDRTNISFGIVNKKTFRNIFGHSATPSIYVYDSEDKLVKKIFGAIKISKLLEYVKI